MRRSILAAVLTAGVLLAPTAATVSSAAPATVLGSFVSAKMRAGQPHRVYVVVEAGRGSKQCNVTLRRRTIDVDLGTDHRGAGMFLFLTTAGARHALAQALAAPSPTRRIRCSH